MKILGIHGKAGSGKDTIGDYLVDHHSYLKFAFANPLKCMIDTAFGPIPWNDRRRKEAPLPRIGKSPRQLAQTLGTEWGRTLVHPDVWVILMEQSINEVASANWTTDAGVEGIVITDVRFENEAEWIRKRGGQVWHLRRDTAGVTDHPSEDGVGVHEGDSVILNRGTIDELYSSVERLLAARAA
jgi:hypothetical protein